MRVPFMDLGWQIAQLRDEIDAAIADCVDNHSFVQGKRVARFEEEYATFAGAKHAIGCSSGTDALYLAFIAAGIQPGDEVILPTMTFFATIEAVRMVQAEPVLVDIDEETSTMDIDAVKAAITPRTRAIVPVLLYGRPARMDAITGLAREAGAVVIGDAAQAHGATYDGKPVGHYATVTCYSFYPGKNLGAFGDAGACTTDDSDLARDMKMRRDHGRESKYEHDFYGVNMRMDEIQGAVLRVKLGRLAQWTARRQEIARRYVDGLQGVGDLRLPSLDANGGSVWHLFVVRTERRDALREHLSAAGISSGIHYPIPLHLQPACTDLSLGKGAFPVSERASLSIASLPMFAGMTSEQQDYVIAEARAFYGAD